MPPWSYLNLENDSESVYTNYLKSSDCKVGENNSKENPDFTFIKFIKFSFKLLVT